MEVCYFYGPRLCYAPEKVSKNNVEIVDLTKNLILEQQFKEVPLIEGYLGRSECFHTGLRSV